MGLPQGSQLGPYEIVNLLGVGGMGEVYRAHDSKLKRDVAVKVLPQQFSTDEGRVARFRREAQVLAALNHPNIAAIYGMEESGETTALVMEIVEGGDLTLPLPIDTALDYGRQIAEALEAAHDKGIIHRDLKPSNIKVTPSGVVKVLDFGLATIAQEGDADSAYDLQNSPTLTRTTGTQAGVILGTAAYMSPEQAAGKVVDKRSDIWAFGVVLFEMLTGQRLFPGGETVSHLLADVLRAPIDLSRLPAATPPAVRDLLERCLERNVKNRLRDIGEARLAIDRARNAPVTVASAAEARRAGTKSLAATLAIALIAVVLAGIAGAGWWRAIRTLDRPFLRFTDNTEEILETNTFGPSVAISPDGLRVALVTMGADGKSRLAIRSLGSSKFSVISGTEDDSPVSPFFSPDGLSLGYFSQSKLKKIPVEGGAAVTLCDIGGSGLSRGGFWGEDQYILFATQRSPIMRVSSSGGTPAPLTQLESDEVTNRFPQLLPGSGAVLFTASADNNVWESATIAVHDLKTGVRKTLMTGGYFGRYVTGANGSGYLTYVHEGSLFAAPMDVKTLQLTGPGIPVLEGVGQAQNGIAQLDVAQSGTFVYLPGLGGNRELSLGLMDLSGKIQPLQAPLAEYVAPAMPSPDGKRIMIRVRDGQGVNLAVYELVSGQMTRVTFLKGAVGATGGAWTPDSKHIVFPLSSNELSGPGIYWMRADGASEPVRLTNRYSNPWSFAPDGKRIAYSVGAGTNNDEFGIWTLPLNLDDPERPKPGTAELFLKSKTALGTAVFSPDGHWIAYNSSEAEPPQVFVRPFSPGSPAAGGRWQITADGGTLAGWSFVSQELIYMVRPGAVAVPYTAAGDSFTIKPSRQLFQRPESQLAGQAALMPDGKTFAVVTPGLQRRAPRTHVAFLLNFPDELKRRVAGGDSK